MHFKQKHANISLHDLHTLDIGSNADYCGRPLKEYEVKKMEEEESKEDEMYDPFEDDEEDLDF